MSDRSVTPVLLGNGLRRLVSHRFGAEICACPEDLTTLHLLPAPQEIPTQKAAKMDRESKRWKPSLKRQHPERSGETLVQPAHESAKVLLHVAHSMGKAGWH
mmetsp:Transcript_20569/g.33857  ORF Transcript_20569/g.33857 Transcript_20569/m.33857 type:complete len:102 (+) Transcript_20569:713-1018(+)